MKTEELRNYSGCIKTEDLMKLAEALNSAGFELSEIKRAPTGHEYPDQSSGKKTFVCEWDLRIRPIYEEKQN